MRIRANVVRATGMTVHRRAEIVDRSVAPGEALPVPAWVEIDVASSGCFLYHYDAASRCIADTWHLDLADAKSQAEFEFGVGEGDWVEVTN